MMTILEVIERVEDIRCASGDDERAHGMEDDLHQDVLAAIPRDDAENPAVMAEEALKTGTISFERWCA